MDTRTRNWLSWITDMDRDVSSGGVFMKTLTVAATLGVGISQLAEAEDVLAKFAAGALILVGAANSAFLGNALNAWARQRTRNVPVDVGTDNAAPAELRATVSIVGTSIAMTKEARVHAAVDEVDANDADERLQAAFFFGGLMLGVLGAVVSIIGVAAGLYAVAMTGSIIASIGFVTVACALISAQQAEEEAA